MTQRHIYSCRYRHRDDPFGRVYRATVIARSADEARAYLAIKDPQFGSTVASPKRRGMVEPEQADGLTASKARDFVTVDGGRHGDIDIEWVD